MGRRITLYSVAAWTYAGVVAAILARDWRTWLAAKILIGWATGVMQAAVPTYVAEVAPRQARAVMLSLFNLCSGSFRQSPLRQ